MSSKTKKEKKSSKKDKKRSKDKSKSTEPSKDKSDDSTQLQDERGGSLDVFLHPLVLVAISDHYTREKVRKKIEKPRAVGALLGVQTGRKVEVKTCYELVCTLVDGKWIIDTEYLNTKTEQIKEVFKTYDFLGWYSTGDALLPEDIEIQKQLLELNENPLYLLLGTNIAMNAREIPLKIYESQIKFVNDAAVQTFVSTGYKIDTGSAEGVAVDHVANARGTESTASRLTLHLSALQSAVEMLHIRIQAIVRYIKAAQAGGAKFDHTLIRQVSGICNMLPAIDSAEIGQDFVNEYSDALLVTYLASMTNTSNTLNELIDKFNVTYDRHNRRRGYW
mmetsp:Transcript_1171/g.1338  ORF Transcript_1171/g.1338 Transcript_1171/m.1338 type:complete len:334 (+) Transcript_1171:23-1024(+)